MALFRTLVEESRTQTIPFAVGPEVEDVVDLEGDTEVATETMIASRTDTSTATRTVAGAAGAVDGATAKWIAGGVAVAAVGIFIGILIFEGSDEVTFTPVQGVSIFAVLYILAQAIERLMEPMTAWVGGNKKEAEEERDEAVAAALNAEGMPATTAAAQTAAAAQRSVDQIRKNRAVFMWGVATAAAAIGAGFLHLSLMSVIGFTGLNTGIDLAITALAVGGGTKPLHDLISRIEKAKENAEDPPETSA